MRVAVISDLHLEFEDLQLPGGDVLILSGDVMEARYLKKDQLNVHQRFFAEECSKYKDVIYVMGNHEHYGGRFGKTYAQILEQLPDNVHLLEDESYTIDDVTFVGATLWTDMNNMDALTMYHMKSMMMDYKKITHFYEDRNLYYKLTPEVTVEKFYRSRDYIKMVVEGKHDQKFVVCTHHAPTRASTHPRYAHDTIMNGAYSSDLSEFILDNPQIIAWHHGHTHDRFSYMVGSTWVSCNPRGYAGYEHQADEFKVRSYDIINGIICNKDDWGC